MSSLSALFVIAVATVAALRLWLLARQSRAVSSHRSTVPAPFAERISPAEHSKAADYTLANARLARVSIIIDSLVTLALTVGGGIALIDRFWAARTGWREPWIGGAVILSIVVLNAVFELPVSLWRTFQIEARFGFNRMTARLFCADLAKSALLGLLIGGPVVIAALLLMQRAGELWWLWAWSGWLLLTLLMSWAWPVLIAPLFNRFTHLEDPNLRQRIEALLARCGFSTKGVFVVDGSRRSAHGNAYFTGLGRNKRIVFFDTLLKQLEGGEVEAVLAHELGHFRLKHVRKRLMVSVVVSFGALALLGWLAGQRLFYGSLGVPTPSPHAALLLFALVVPVVTFLATPLASMWSRRHEFEADAFAAQYSSARALASALTKLYRDNATTLTPDELYSTFYYSHPPALERIARLRQLQSAAQVPDSPAPVGAG